MITLLPAETGVTKPVLLTVATPCDAETHGLETAAVPDPVNCVVGPIQTLKLPAIVGNAFTVTEPFTILETHPVVMLLTINTNEIELPDAGELKFTVMGEVPNVPFETVVIPVPDMLYWFGLPVVPVKGMVNEFDPAQMLFIVPSVIVGNAFTVTEPFTMLETHPVVLLLTVNTNEIELPDASELKFTVMGEVPNVPFETVVIPVPDKLYWFGLPVVPV